MVPAGDGFLRTAMQRENREQAAPEDLVHAQPGVTNVAGVRLWLCQQGQRYKSLSLFPALGSERRKPGLR